MIDVPLLLKIDKDTGNVRSRFDSLPSAFNVCLIPPSSKRSKKKRKGFLSNVFQKKEAKPEEESEQEFEEVSKNESEGETKWLLKV
ncbi:hypothetical protein PIB30_054576 [Stylosanthes scabra]|uniref:Uncharacterized protein n=1 Tax=Stylosanthes scabra TaxID=79078 RepID=A0ABU6UMB6_9FABA|nr:hypothetical protein [Stylosanthes scabra]